MTQNVPLLTLSVEVAADPGVAGDSFGTLDGQMAPAGGNAAGVYRSDGKTGDMVPLDVLGTAVVIAGAAVAVGDELEVGSVGTAVPKSAGITVARAVTAASGLNERIEVLIIPN